MSADKPNTPPEKEPPKDGAKPEPSASAEVQAADRVKELKSEIKFLEGDLHITRGKITNRTTTRAPEFQKENTLLQARLKNLEKALFGVIIEGFKPRQSDDFNHQVETLRQAAVEYCKESKIDPELWKNIAY